MSLYHISPLSYSTSTQSNPFSQGGWKAATHFDSKAQRRHLTDLNIRSVPEPQSYGALPLPWSSDVRPKSASGFVASTTTFRFIPTPSDHNDRRLINCAILGPQDRVLYTVSTQNPSLTIVKDSTRHPVALVEWASMPVVDIRGDKGKKPLDQWLIQDGFVSNAQSMLWKGAWYCWTADETNIYLHAQSQFVPPLAVVRASGAMFEVEFSREAMKCGLLEPSLVAVLLLQWGNNYFI